MAGLVCDTHIDKKHEKKSKLFNTAAMNLYKFNNIYFPDEDFYNCQYFPPHWIEIFVEEGKALESEDIGEQDKKIQPYTPICTKAELKKMLEGNMKSTKYSNVRGKTNSMNQRTAAGGTTIAPEGYHENDYNFDNVLILQSY